jgi:hypothetical protein
MQADLHSLSFNFYCSQLLQLQGAAVLLPQELLSSIVSPSVSPLQMSEAHKILLTVVDDLDTVHNAAETSAKLSRNSSKGPKMWSKGLRPGYAPIPGSSQPGAGPLSTRNNGSHSTRKSVGAKVQQTAPLKKLTVEWTLITSPNGNIRKRASDFLYKANTIYDLSLLYEGKFFSSFSGSQEYELINQRVIDMLSQGVAALNRVFLQSPGSGSIEDYDLVEYVVSVSFVQRISRIDSKVHNRTDYRLIHARTSTDLGVDFFDMTLSEALEACDQSPALADTYLEGKKSGAPVIANNYSPRIRITVSVNLTQVSYFLSSFTLHLFSLTCIQSVTVQHSS